MLKFALVYVHICDLCFFCPLWKTRLLEYILDENTGKSGHPSCLCSIVIMHTRPNRKSALFFYPWRMICQKSLLRRPIYYARSSIMLVILLGVVSDFARYEFLAWLQSISYVNIVCIKYKYIVSIYSLILFVNSFFEM